MLCRQHARQHSDSYLRRHVGVLYPVHNRAGSFPTVGELTSGPSSLSRTKSCPASGHELLGRKANRNSAFQEFNIKKRCTQCSSAIAQTNSVQQHRPTHKAQGCDLTGAKQAVIWGCVASAARHNTRSEGIALSP